MPVSKFPLRFLRRGQWTELDSVNPNTTLLDFIREVEPAGLGCRGTKEGCAQGDCGACAVLIAELAPTSNEIRLRSINACIKPLSSIDGCALWTVEDLQDDQGRLHPVQHALVKAHGSQCGFCTPGFVMSLVALYETRLLGKPDTAKPLTRDAVLEAISGNLCRCTGYAPIVAAGMMLESYLPADGTIGDAIVTSPASDAHSGSRADLASGTTSGAAHNGLMTAGQPAKLLRALQDPAPARPFRPRTLKTLLSLRSKHPQVQIVAGATDVGLWINKQHRRFEQTLDVGAVGSLQKISATPSQWTIGAAARLTEVFGALCRDWPQLHSFASRFAGLTIRNSATLGGNIANGSPIGDSMPLLIALGARLRLQSVRETREMPIEEFFLGFRRTALQADEILTAILIPRAGVASKNRSAQVARLRAYKISKRFEDDISAVCLAIAIEVDSRGLIAAARIGAGGVAAIPARARATEQSLLGQSWSEASIAQAARTLSEEFDPITDLRASSAYRKRVLAALMQRFWLEENGQTMALEAVTPLPEFSELQGLAARGSGGGGPGQNPVNQNPVNQSPANQNPQRQMGPQ